MSTHISDSVRNTAVDAVTALINGGGAGTMEIWSGAQPAGGPAATATGVKLATVTFAATAFGAASAGVATAAAIVSDTTTVVGGTAGYARIKSGAGTALIDMKVGLTGDTTAQLTFNSVTFITGGTCAINSMTCTCASTV